jgi:hypothetical protein
LRAEA